eukprot:g23426.t1
MFARRAALLRVLPPTGHARHPRPVLALGQGCGARFLHRSAISVASPPWPDQADKEQQAPASPRPAQQKEITLTSSSRPNKALPGTNRLRRIEGNKLEGGRSILKRYHAPNLIKKVNRGINVSLASAAVAVSYWINSPEAVMAALPCLLMIRYVRKRRYPLDTFVLEILYLPAAAPAANGRDLLGLVLRESFFDDSTNYMLLLPITEVGVSDQGSEMDIVWIPNSEVRFTVTKADFSDYDFLLLPFTDRARCLTKCGSGYQLRNPTGCRPQVLILETCDDINMDPSVAAMRVI